MVDFNRMAATLWRNAEDDMRRTYGDPNVMSKFIPYDKMDDYARARGQAIAENLRHMLENLGDCIERNLDEFHCGKLPSCLRCRSERD